MPSALLASNLADFRGLPNSRLFDIFFNLDCFVFLLGRALFSDLALSPTH
ncbi:hypothetical protein BGZ60DRAFT_279764 [Tricladium varicosporioides]|nr:hypothetical protein BGZ60DRAFT_279764 [Hymenoscyphus varicosporioides]